MGQANLKARRREERAELARAREANPEAGELPAGEELRPEQIEYWQAQVHTLQQRLVEVIRAGRSEIQLRVQTTQTGDLALVFGAGPWTTQIMVTAEGARHMAEMIARGADEADRGAERPPDLATPPAGLWTPGNGRGG